MRSSIKKIVLVFSVVLIMGVLTLFKYLNSNKIERILKSESYNYLPLEAKKYIEDVYNETGKVLLTEKNKKENTPYLNPVYIDYLSMADEEQNAFGDIPMPVVVDYVKSDADIYTTTLPSSYDLRNVNGKNFITPVRNQGDLGLCWAFSSAETVESYVLQKNDTSYETNPILISERQIDYATSKDGISDYSNNKYNVFINRSLGDGGNFYISTVLMASGVSAVNYNDFKAYNDKDLEKVELSDTISYKKSVYELNSTIDMPRLNLRASTGNLSEDEMNTFTSYINLVKTNIMKYGAAYVSTYMNSACYYKDTNSNKLVLDVYGCGVSGGHAMQIIGWDDNFEYSYCYDNNNHKELTSNCKKSVTGKGAWILRNSWGETEPYLYLTYDSQYTGIDFITDLTLSKDKTWDNNYLLSDDEKTYTNKTYNFSSLDINDNEILKKVKLIVFGSNSEYKIKVNGVNQTKEYTVTNELPGLITFDIDDIEINKNSKITISSTNEFEDKLIIMTGNKSTTPYVDLSKYENNLYENEDVRLYSTTKNIPSGEEIEYEVYDYVAHDVTNKFTITKNIVGANEVNAIINFPNDLDNGEYLIIANYNSKMAGSAIVQVSKMEGEGTKENPYIITNAIQFNQIRNNLTAYYELANDIDLSKETNDGGSLSVKSSYCPQKGFGWESINGFSGSLDGKGHTIKGLNQKKYITCYDKSGNLVEDSYSGDNGLFGKTTGNVTIKNLSLEDFDISCSEGACGLLVSTYSSDTDSSENPYVVNFENISIKNNKTKSTYYAYGLGLFGSMYLNYGTINITNIYIDHNIELSSSKTTALLAKDIYAQNININNVRLLGNIDGKYDDGSGDRILVYNLLSYSSANIKNILSTVTAVNTDSNLMHASGNNITFENINVLKNIDNVGIISSNDDKIIQKNVNILENVSDFVNYDNFKTWDLDTDWKYETIDDIKRMPALKFANNDYTKIDDITINQELNQVYNIYDYLTPKKDSINKLSFSSNDENILNIWPDGTIEPVSTGKATVHIESLYDGFIKDVPVSLTYTPHYNVVFDTNGGDAGLMDSIEVSVNENVTLPKNSFTKKNYDFNGWNTKPDGTGEHYDDMAVINAHNDRETIILYAQWIGEEIVITFNPNGGEVNPTTKIIHYGETYGELPLPYKENSAFSFWVCNSMVISSYSSYSNSCKILKASWDENAYNLVYYANGGTLNGYVTGALSDTMVAISIRKNYDQKFKKDIFVNDGYNFIGWNTKPDGTGDSYLADEIVNFTNVEKSKVELYAQWEKPKVKITYCLDNSCTIKNEKEYEKGQLIKIDECTIEMAGYYFDSWNTKYDGTGQTYNEGQEITLDNDLILYPIFRESFTYSIKDYFVDENSKVISKIIVGTTEDDFRNHINLGINYSVIVDTKNSLLYTGGKTKIYNIDGLVKEYVNVVIGDINGDGITNSADLLKIRQHLIGVKPLEGIYFTSADINYDSIVNSADLLRIRQHLIGTKLIG